MYTPIVRITKINMKNFKNVVNGTLLLENSRKDYKASIVGIYGQNGSGKTAVIEAVGLLKCVLCNQSVPAEYADCINIDSEEATLYFEFSVRLPSGSYTVSYQFSIKSVTNSSDNDSVSDQQYSKKILVFNELLKCPILTEKTVKMGRLIDTSGDTNSFSPVPKRVLLAGNEKAVSLDLHVAKIMSLRSSRSFVFSEELLDIIRKNVEAYKAMNKLPDDLNLYYTLIESLVEFGKNGLFVIRTSQTGVISLNAQPFIFKYREGRQGYQGIILLPLDNPVDIPTQTKEIVEKIVSNMNTVLLQLIPGLTIGVRDLGALILPNGEQGNRIQLVSCRNNKELPLKNESDGIKKIISILQLLIVVYNQPSLTVAVDELDAGVFEYLLGELLRIIAEKGKGNLSLRLTICVRWRRWIVVSLLLLLQIQTTVIFEWQT